MSLANINPQILKWARQRPGINEVKILGFHDNYLSWEKGEKKPTIRQAKELAKKLRIPFGYLYLSAPPEDKITIPDLRTIKNIELDEFSVDLKDVIDDALRKQNWYSEKLKEDGEIPLPFIGKFNINSPVEEIASDISQTCQISFDARKSNFDQISFLTNKIENVGILVLRNGKVGFNTHRPLSVDEFRGFALSDPYAPLIFINNRDYETAKIFTLIHEVSHLWLGEEGISNMPLNSFQSNNRIERKCNQIAAEVLVPQRVFLEKWEQTQGNLEHRFIELHKVFRTSTIMLARRALEFGFIDRYAFSDYYGKLLEIWAKNKKQNSGGGDFNNSFPVASSSLVLNAISQDVISAKMLIRNGASLLGIKPSSLVRYIKNQGQVL